MNLHVLSLILLMLGCTSRDTMVDKTKLLGTDYRLFQETPAWELAKAVEDENVDKIKAEVGKNKGLINFKEGRFNETLLLLAVDNKNFTSVKTLLELGADPNAQDSVYGYSPIMRAAKLGSEISSPDTRFLKILLKYGGDPNAVQNGRRKTKETPLIIACESGVLEYVKILVDAGANINYVNEYGDTALESAADAVSPDGDPALVIYLIDKGADFRKVLYTTVDGDKKYLTDAMRFWRFELGSDHYKKKMQLVEFLKKNGMDYRKSVIPDWYFKNYSKDYLEKY